MFDFGDLEEPDGPHHAHKGAEKAETTLIVHLDRSLDLKTEIHVRLGASVSTVKQALADSDPTGSTDPSSFALKQPDSLRVFRDGEPLPLDLTELELCAPRKERVPISDRAVNDSAWGASCETAFTAALPPRWEFQSRGRGSGWTAFPDAAVAVINTYVRRGQRRGNINVDGLDLVVDVQDRVAVPADSRAPMPRAIRKCAQQPRVSKSRIKELYLRYAEELPPNDHPSGPDGIAGEGVLELFQDLEVDAAADVAALALSAACDASEMGVLRRCEFICGCAKLEVDNLEALRLKMPELRQKVLSGETLHEVYAYTFSVALEVPSKVLPFEEAEQYWALLLPGWALREDFCSWANAHMKRKAVNRDLWMQVLKFSREVTTDLSTYDDNPSWPVVFDDFVEYMRELRGC